MRVRNADVGRIQIGQQQVDELVAQRAALRRHHRDLGLRVAAGGHHRQRELQAQRPALGQFVQARGGVAVDAGAEARAHQLDRLVELEAQLRRADDGARRRRRRGRRCSSWQSARAATTARRLAGALRSR